MATFGIRVPSVDELLDPYSTEPLERRPLCDDIRERILYEWIDTREDRPSHLVVQLPADRRRPELDRRLSAAIRHDLEGTYEETGRLRTFTRGERQEAWIGFGFLAVCLTASGRSTGSAATTACSTGSRRGSSCSAGSPSGGPPSATSGRSRDGLTGAATASSHGCRSRSTGSESAQPPEARSR